MPHPASGFRPGPLPPVFSAQGGRLMGAAHGRHHIPDRVWEKLEPHLPGRKRTWGGVARDNRQFINAVFWIMRTGAPWRALPPDYGDWKNTHRSVHSMAR